MEDYIVVMPRGEVSILPIKCGPQPSASDRAKQEQISQIARI